MPTVLGRLPVEFPRKFHLRGYEGSHAQLLFRSGRSGYHRGEYLKYDSVVDILFKDVAALAVAENYYPLRISLADDSAQESFRRFLGCEVSGRNLYVLQGGDSVGYVLAGAMYWVDDPKGTNEEASMLIVNPNRLGDLEVMRA